VVGDFVVPGQGKMAQRKAKQLVKVIADAKAYRELQLQEAPSKAVEVVQVCGGQAEAGDIDMGSASQASTDTASGLESRLAGADAAVARWEAIPAASRELVPGFEQHLAAAREARDAVLQEKRASKPWIWRLKGAERLAARAERCKKKVAEEIDSLLAQQLELEQRPVAKHAEMEAAHVAHAEAAASVATVRAEAATYNSSAAGETQRPSTAAADIIQGLVSQLGELPRAAASGNWEAALRSVVEQAQALRSVVEQSPDPSMVDAGSKQQQQQQQVAITGHRPPGTHAAVSAMVAEGEAITLDGTPAPMGHRPPGTEECAAWRAQRPY